MFACRVRAGHRSVLLAAFVLLLAACGRDNGSQATDTQKKAVRPDGPADAATLRRHFAGHTVTGRMGAGKIVEFYAPGGIIRGAGYRAEWFIQGDRLCLNYDEATPADCYQVRIDGTHVEWRMDGERRGAGTLVEGNPQNL